MSVDISRDEPLAANSAEPDDTTHLFAELDALLARMLALPVNSLEAESETDRPPILGEDVAVITIAEAAPESPLPFTAPPPPVSISQDLYLQEVLAEREQSPVPLSPPLPQLTAVPERQEHDPLPLLPPRLVDDAGPSAARFSPMHKADAAPSAGQPPAPGWQRPLLWANSIFEHSTLPLGRAGAWLRGDQGRSLLGWAGLLLFATAVGLAAWDWFAWPR